MNGEQPGAASAAMPFKTLRSFLAELSSVKNWKATHQLSLVFTADGLKVVNADGQMMAQHFFPESFFGYDSGAAFQFESQRPIHVQVQGQQFVQLLGMTGHRETCSLKITAGERQMLISIGHPERDATRTDTSFPVAVMPDTLLYDVRLEGYAARAEVDDYQLIVRRVQASHAAFVDLTAKGGRVAGFAQHGENDVCLVSFRTVSVDGEVAPRRFQLQHLLSVSPMVDTEGVASEKDTDPAPVQMSLSESSPLLLEFSRTRVFVSPQPMGREPGYRWAAPSAGHPPGPPLPQVSSSSPVQESRGY